MEGEGTLVEGERNVLGERTPLLHADSRQLENRPNQDEEEVADGPPTPAPAPATPPAPGNCSQWRPQLVGIELAGCLHSFSSGLHEVSHPLPSNMFHLELSR